MMSDVYGEKRGCRLIDKKAYCGSCAFLIVNDSGFPRPIGGSSIRRPDCGVGSGTGMETVVAGGIEMWYALDQGDGFWCKDY
ncbi:hypothetical protein AKJ16_DCAP06991 [Drosera capensis]